MSARALYEQKVQWVVNTRVSPTPVHTSHCTKQRLHGASKGVKTPSFFLPLLPHRPQWGQSIQACGFSHRFIRHQLPMNLGGSQAVAHAVVMVTICSGLWGDAKGVSHFSHVWNRHFPCGVTEHITPLPSLSSSFSILRCMSVSLQ